jgi:hypothetical protein
MFVICKQSIAHLSDLYNIDSAWIDIQFLHCRKHIYNSHSTDNVYIHITKHRLEIRNSISTYSCTSKLGNTGFICYEYGDHGQLTVHRSDPVPWSAFVGSLLFSVSCVLCAVMLDSY